MGATKAVAEAAEARRRAIESFMVVDCE